jgi:hypothetical protein
MLFARMDRRDGTAGGGEDVEVTVVVGTVDGAVVARGAAMGALILAGKSACVFP